MRKVKFPLVLDVMDLVSENAEDSVPQADAPLQVTDELRSRLQPMNAFARQRLRDRGGKHEQTDEAIQQEVKRISESQGLPTDPGTNYTAVYELMGERVTDMSSLRVLTRDCRHREPQGGFG